MNSCQGSHLSIQFSCVSKNKNSLYFSGGNELYFFDISGYFSIFVGPCAAIPKKKFFFFSKINTGMC
jgi:hypothetical protein